MDGLLRHQGSRPQTPPTRHEPNLIGRILAASPGVPVLDCRLVASKWASAGMTTRAEGDTVCGIDRRPAAADRLDCPWYHAWYHGLPRRTLSATPDESKPAPEAGFRESGRLDSNQRPLGPQPRSSAALCARRRPARPMRPGARHRWTHRTLQSVPKRYHDRRRFGSGPDSFLRRLASRAAGEVLIGTRAFATGRCCPAGTEQSGEAEKDARELHEMSQRPTLRCRRSE